MKFKSLVMMSSRALQCIEPFRIAVNTNYNQLHLILILNIANNGKEMVGNFKMVAFSITYFFIFKIYHKLMRYQNMFLRKYFNKIKVSSMGRNACVEFDSYIAIK